MDKLNTSTINRPKSEALIEPKAADSEAACSNRRQRLNSLIPNRNDGESVYFHLWITKPLPMPVVGLNHFNITACPDLVEELRCFYVEVIGLTVGPRARLNH